MSRHATPRIGVIGCGPWGNNHLRVLQELGALAAACDPDPATLARVASAYPDVMMTAGAAEVLEDDTLDGVVIAAPAARHGELTRLALEAGKDVLVEKPMALSVDEASELCDLAERTGRVLAVGHVLEYHPVITKLKALVHAGELGRIHYLYANRLNFGRMRTEENVLWSFAPHDLAITLRLLGSLPDSVACHGGSYVSPGVADVTSTQLSFSSGVRAHVFVSWAHPFKEHRYVVMGERRMLVFDDTAPWPEKLMSYEHGVEWKDGQTPVARKVLGTAIAVEPAEPLTVQAEMFLEAISTRTPPLADAQSGLAVLRILHAAQQSLELGGIPVRVGQRQKLLDPAGVHPTATIEAGAIIGEGTKVWHHAHVMTQARIGRDCVLGKNVFVGRGVRIGDGVRLQNNVSVFEGVELANHVFCGPSVVFTNVRTPRAAVGRRGDFDVTRVGEGATIGANATIVCGTTLGRYAFVGAGAVVTRDVPAHGLVVGNPARPIGWSCTCGVRLGDPPTTCFACGRSYEPCDGGIRDTDEQSAATDNGE